MGGDSKLIRRENRSKKMDRAPEEKASGCAVAPGRSVKVAIGRQRTRSTPGRNHARGIMSDDVSKQVCRGWVVRRVVTSMTASLLRTHPSGPSKSRRLVWVNESPNR